MKTERAQLGDTLHYYSMAGVKKGQIAPWEDGRRTTGGKGDYEWWYFDSHLEGGASLVIVFYTKPMGKSNGPLAPQATLELNLPDGRQFFEVVEVPPGSFSASEQSCDVRIGPCRFQGNLRDYQIYFESPQVKAAVRLSGNVPAWRPETGHMYFGDRDEALFAWLPSVPEGDVRAEITIGGKTETYAGTGYHDHNWGNAPMQRLMHHWYWGRAKVGPYQVISSYITAEKRYGYTEIPIFMLARDGKVLAGDAQRHLRFSPSGVQIDPRTNKPVHDTLEYLYTDGGERWRVTYRREAVIGGGPMLDRMKGAVRLAAKLSGFDGAYLRFSGTATVEHFTGGRTADCVSAPAIWELMYFGRTRQESSGTQRNLL